MVAVLWLVMGGILVVGAGVPFYVLCNETRGYLLLLLLAVLVAAFPLALYMTGDHVEIWNENTYAIGWPVPKVVMQRSAPGRPYLDYIGPTLILAYPLNYCLFTIVPTSLILSLTIARKVSLAKAARARKEDGEASSAA